MPAAFRRADPCWVEFPRDAVRWIGAGGMPSLHRSSDCSSRAFCPCCGSTLGAVDDAPTIGLVTGGLDAADSEALRPGSHSFVPSRPHWWKVEGE